MKRKKLKIIITDQPESPIRNVQYVSKKELKTVFHRDLGKLVKENKASFLGRVLNKSNGEVYQMFTIGEKRIFLEDPEATEMLVTLLDQDGIVREFEISSE